MVSSSPVALHGPDTQLSSCMWHLQAGPGSQLELHMEWLLPECRDRLVVYNSLTPTDTHLITSLVSYIYTVYSSLLNILVSPSVTVSHCIIYKAFNICRFIQRWSSSNKRSYTIFPTLFLSLQCVWLQQTWACGAYSVIRRVDDSGLETGSVQLQGPLLTVCTSLGPPG